ncbi:V-type ATP synthase subunit I [Enterococcus sp.]|uniref:V-type ATP synthase subunit I n=1 Tax=Enterococcus sp. TaxID=35783 RepID=UPI0025BBBB96|nr:V-type ATP synthase subunit I [Enterococcus sp.]
MAVTKLSKLTVIAPKQHQERLLKKLQSLQMVEIEDVFENAENQPWLQEFFADYQQEAVTTYKETLHRIQEAILFVRRQGGNGKTREWQRQSLPLSAFEKNFQEADILLLVAEIEALQEQWQKNLEATQATTEAETWGMEWQNLDVALEEPDLASATIFCGSLESSHWESLTASLKQFDTVYLEMIYSDPKKTNFSCLYPNKLSSEVEGLFQRYSVKKEVTARSQKPKQVLSEAQKQLRELADQKKQLAQQIGTYKTKIDRLQQAEEYFLTQEQRKLVQKRLVSGEQFTVLRGWVSQQEQPTLEKELVHAFHGEVYCSFNDPTEADLTANRVPVKLQNASFIQPFEMLTEMYSLPKYDEIDPTPWMTPFYYVFFGMMVADLGYGGLMALVTTIGLRFFPLPKGTKRFMKLFQTLSIPTMIWGLIYGSFFGAALPFHLLSPAKDFMAIFGLSMIFGGIQLFTGLYLAAKENIRKKDYLAAVNQGFSWQGLLAGLMVAAAGKWLFQAPVLVTLGIILAALSGLLIVIVPIMKGKSKVGGFFMGLYDLYGVTSYIGDFVSYSRLMALGISGGSIAAAFNLLVGYMPPVARFSVGIILLVILQALNIFLSLLSAYVHAARLQYVEFFGKFFTGGGRAFDTFKPSEKYVDFEKENGGTNDD